MPYSEEKGYYGYIYKIYNDNNDKLYVGQTRRELRIRWRDHLKDSKSDRDGMILYRAIRKYGKETFHIESLEEVRCSTKDELILKLNELEIKYIAELNTLIPNGYNMGKGGFNNADTRKKQVDQYDLQGNYIQTFESIRDAEMIMKSQGHKRPHIGDCCNGKQVISCGYKWRYHGEEFDSVQIIDKRERPVDVYDLSGNYLFSSSTIKESVEKLGINAPRSNSTIPGVCRGKGHQYKGYVWRYQGEPFDKYSLEYATRSDARKVYVFDKNDNFIAMYESAGKAAKAQGCNRSAVYTSRRDHMPCYGLYYYFEGDEYLLSHPAI